MTQAIAQPVALLLAELAQRGITIEAARGRLRYRPHSAMTSGLIDRLKAHKTALLVLLQPSDGKPDRSANLSPAPYTDREHELLANAPGSLRATVNRIKTTFADTSATVIDVQPDPTWPRRRAARLVRQVRRAGGRVRAIILRDAWHERVAICTIDGGLSVEDAGMIAVEEITDDSCQMANIRVSSRNG